MAASRHFGWLLLVSASYLLGPTVSFAAVTHRQLRRKSGSTERYFLLQYSNQFCAAGSVSACQEVAPDGFCHMSGTGDAYVKATENADGTINVQPGTNSDCDCANKDVLSEDYVADTVNIYGEFEAPQNSGCLTEGGIGVRLVTGTWCEADTFTECPPDHDKFTQMIKQNCPRGYASDVSSAGMCNYASFKMERRTVIKQGRRMPSQQTRASHSGVVATAGSTLVWLLVVPAATALTAPAVW